MVVADGSVPAHELVTATKVRLGFLFTDFAGTSDIATLFFGIKVLVKVIRGVLLGAFYGG
jgi:hypothetical protein